jgi:ABC-2 type transport system ATP-binding protein
MGDLQTAIEAEGLHKAYGKTVALRGLDLTVERGTILGVLGPNGAGKTTTVRILATLLRPDAGRATVDGYDVVLQAPKVRSRIGLTGQFAAIDDLLTGRENLELVGTLSHLGSQEVRQRASQLLERFRLSDAASRLARTYSGGMRRRLDLAASLLAAPSILFLDEPTTGLDPRSRMEIWEVIRELVAEGTTVLLTTQYLEEADQLADRIVVVDGGRVIASGTAADLKSRVGGERVELVLGDSSDLAQASEILSALSAGRVTTDHDSRRLTMPVSAGASALPSIIRGLDDSGVRIVDIALRQPTLDDAFLILTGQDDARTDHLEVES